MLKTLTFAILLITSVGSHAQSSEFDPAKELSTKNKTQIVYLTAAWCSPCMEKLQPIITAFGNKEAYELVVLMDRHGLSEKVSGKIKSLYDTSLLRLFPARYYPTSNAGFKISVSPSKKVVKALATDLKTNFALNLDPKDLWFGHAIVSSPAGVYVITESDKEKLMQEIRVRVGAK